MKEVPCKNCPNRAIPKTCEKNCKLWQEYRQDKQERYIQYAQTKRLNELINFQKRRDLWEE